MYVIADKETGYFYSATVEGNPRINTITRERAAKFDQHTGEVVCRQLQDLTGKELMLVEESRAPQRALGKWEPRSGA